MAHRKKTNKLKNPPSKWKDELLEKGPKSFMQAILYEQLKKKQPQKLMLSTQYRLRLEAICKDIASNSEVKLEDMIWAEKLAKRNTSARGMLSSARRLSVDPDSTFLKYLDIGDSDPRKHKRGFNGADDIADWFRNDNRSDDWRQRDQFEYKYCQ